MSSFRKIKSISDFNGQNPFPESVRNISVVSPASCPQEKRIQDFCRLCGGLGVSVGLSKNVFASSSRKMPADAELRISDFNGALENKSSDLILCSRGGYGSAQILGKVKWDVMENRDMTVLGYSDITALHLAMIKKKAGIAVSSPMADKFFDALKYDLTAESLRIALGRSPSGKMIYNPSRVEVLKEKSVRGPVLPVNLTILVSMLGTEFMPSLEGYILLVEDVSEPEYKVDRMFTQLQLAGILESCSGLLLGNFTNCGKASILGGIFAKFAKNVTGPVLSGIDFGHVKRRLCFRFGQSIEVCRNGKIII